MYDNMAHQGSRQSHQVHSQRLSTVQHGRISPAISWTGSPCSATRSTHTNLFGAHNHISSVPTRLAFAQAIFPNLPALQYPDELQKPRFYTCWQPEAQQLQVVRLEAWDQFIGGSAPCFSMSVRSICTASLSSAHGYLRDVHLIKGGTANLNRTINRAISQARHLAQASAHMATLHSIDISYNILTYQLQEDNEDNS